MLCVHFGPGQLGLGFIVERVSAAGFAVCLVGRSGKAESTSYGFSFVGPHSTGLGYPEVEWANGYETVDDLPGAVLTIVASRDPLLITCTLKDGILDRKEFIIELVRRRPADAETVLLACENDPHEAYDEIKETLGDCVHMPGVVVDRICSWAEPKRDGADRRVVEAHPSGEWLIEHDGRPSKVLEQLCSAALVETVPPPIKPYKDRKLWAVNGVHVVLGVIARLAGVADLPLGKEREAEFVAMARPLITQLGQGVQHQSPYVEVSPEYAAEKVNAFCESKDTARRLIGSHLVRHDLRGFMDRLSVRIGDAARAADAADADCKPFREVMDLIESLLLQPRKFYPALGPDGEPLDPQPVPTAAIDEQVVAGYERVLDQWMPEEERRRRCAWLRRTLAAQRAMTLPPCDIDS